MLKYTLTIILKTVLFLVSLFQCNIFSETRLVEILEDVCTSSSEVSYFINLGNYVPHSNRDIRLCDYDFGFKAHCPHWLP